MKIYARQVEPEYQDSPLFTDECFPDNIVVCGNRSLKKHSIEIFDNVLEVLSEGELADILENIERDEWYKNATETITEYFPPLKETYSTNAIHALKKLIVEFSSCPSGEENNIICRVLSIVTGETWSYRPIHGCCQSEWNYIYYPDSDWNKEKLQIFEAEYFNTGTEWIVHDGLEEPDSLEDITGYSIYCTSLDGGGLAKEIADISGESPENIILYSFDGYIKTPKYVEARP